MMVGKLVETMDSLKAETLVDKLELLLVEKLVQKKDAK